MATALADLAKDAFVFGYPFVYDLNEVTAMVTRPRTALGAPVNLFAHATKLGDPNDKFVSINNDTLYSVANCDVTKEPLVFHVPDTNDRYYVMQFVDAWTNNFAYVGRRATGTAEGLYLVAGPAWSGNVPSGMKLIRSQTNVFSIVGRFHVNSVADVPSVGALQQQTWLTPLSIFPAQPDSSNRKMGDSDIAPWDKRVGENLRFWEQFRSWMQLFPPPEGDRTFVDMLAPLGVLDPNRSFADVDHDLRELLETGGQRGQEEIEAMTRKGGAEPVNGWHSAIHTFDYNLDNLQIGTIDDPYWKIADRRRSYIQRACAARAGLWGNHGYEAVYAGTYVDDRNEQLNGAHRYEIHFDRTPPVDAFWSITMYDIPDFYLTPNPINRYSIGDRTPGIRVNADGSLDISIQRESPGAERDSNWLPTPGGDFRPLIRMYQPGADVLNGSYELPPIRRVD
jgi:hypothetical protein